MMHLQLCAFADEAGPALEDQIIALQENAIPSIELRGIARKNITAHSLAEAKELKRVLDDAGISVWSIGSPLGKIKITEDFEAHLDSFKHTIELAQTLQASCIRLFSFYTDGAYEESRREVLERLSRFCEAAQGSDVVLCHENEKGIYGDIASRCLDIHQQLPALKAVFDPANFIQCGQDTMEAWTMLAPYVYYLHIKDATPEGKVVPAGRGIGHVPEIVRLYVERGGRVLTLEPHLAVFEGLASLEADEKTNIDPYTYATPRLAFDAGATALHQLILPLSR